MVVVVAFPLTFCGFTQGGILAPKPKNAQMFSLAQMLIKSTSAHLA